jgi:hypothetical protein
MATCEQQAAELVAKVGEGLPIAQMPDGRVGRFGYECSPVVLFSLSPFMVTPRSKLRIEDEQMIRAVSSYTPQEIKQLSIEIQGVVKKSENARGTGVKRALLKM